MSDRDKIRLNDLPPAVRARLAAMSPEIAAATREPDPAPAAAPARERRRARRRAAREPAPTFDDELRERTTRRFHFKCDTREVTPEEARAIIDRASQWWDAEGAIPETWSDAGRFDDGARWTCEMVTEKGEAS
jgi:hypothetical protein